MTVPRAARPSAHRPLRVACAGLLLTALTTGCVLAAELDREADPAGTSEPRATPQIPVPGPVAPAPGASRPAARPTSCPEAGVRVTPGFVDAALGLRATRITLTNCGETAYPVSGYPRLTVLDEDREPLDVEILEGTEGITSGLPDPGPAPLTLTPGESAHTVLAWRNTLGAGPAVRAPYLSVAPADGALPQVVEVGGGLDLGDTGRLGATAWQRTER